MKIEFRPIDKTNYNECIELNVSENQKRFVAPNQVSHFDEEFVPIMVCRQQCLFANYHRYMVSLRGCLLGLLYETRSFPILLLFSPG